MLPRVALGTCGTRPSSVTIMTIRKKARPGGSLVRAPEVQKLHKIMCCTILHATKPRTSSASALRSQRSLLGEPVRLVRNDKPMNYSYASDVIEARTPDG